MGKVSELSYDIEQLFIEGLSDEQIAQELQITVDEVYAWMKANGVAETPQDEEIYSPFNG